MIKQPLVKTRATALSHLKDHCREHRMDRRSRLWLSPKAQANVGSTHQFRRNTQKKS
jgi:hypothetical protein